MDLSKLISTGRVDLGGRDIAVLFVVDASPDGICVADTLTSLEGNIGRQVRLSTVYDTVLNLERKGLVRRVGKSRAENGGRPRQLYGITEMGRTALCLARRMVAYQDLKAA